MSKSKKKFDEFGKAPKQKRINNECLEALNLLKEYGELGAGEWSKKMGYQDSVKFAYIRQKTIEKFKDQIGIRGKLKGTRYYYNNPPLDMPIAKDVRIFEGKVVRKERIEEDVKLKHKEREIIASRTELIKIIKDFGCNFNGECNLVETEPNFCYSCSHQIRIPIPETVRMNRKVSRLQSELKELKQK